MDKDRKLQDILKAIGEYISENDQSSAVLFIVGDAETQKALTECKGSGIVLAQAFGNQMQNNEDFNRLMKALIGSYLSQNPKEKVEFISGLNIAGITPSMN